MRAKRKPTAKTVRAGIRASVPDAKLRKARIILTNEGFAQGSIGGFTGYERENGGEVVKIGAPQDDDARGIMIRGHETRHATRHKPTRKKAVTPNMELAGQIVDDVNIESNPVPQTRSERAYRRAHLAMAVQDLRKVLKMQRAKLKGMLPLQQRNWQLVLSVRVAGMLGHYGATGYDYGTGLQRLPDCEKVRTKGIRKLSDVMGRKTMTALLKVIELAKKRRSRARAIDMLTSIMEKELSIEEEEREESELEKMPPELEDKMISETEGGGSAMDGHMEIVNLLPKNVPCSKQKELLVKLAPDGVIVNPTRFVNAIANGNAAGLFSRHVKQKSGGVILIDASGSMSANAKNLTALCELCPSATVAYYSGWNKGRGKLVVYAFKGKRFGKELPEHTVHGGNAVDLPAIKWMMRLPKPWTLISDLGFCGGMLGAEIVAKAMVERATERGDLTVYKSLDAAYEAFGGKEGGLRNR